MITMYDDNMRTIIELPDIEVERLEEVCTRLGISRAEAIRRAVTLFLGLEKQEEAFGMWKDRGIDSLHYQKSLREEWDG
jgi:metal-responsive CopG/Arc/MetJ family transcriptional regulator